MPIRAEQTDPKLLIHTEISSFWPTLRGHGQSAPRVGLSTVQCFEVPDQNFKSLVDCLHHVAGLSAMHSGCPKYTYHRRTIRPSRSDCSHVFSRNTKASKFLSKSFVSRWKICLQGWTVRRSTFFFLSIQENHLSLY